MRSFFIILICAIALLQSPAGAAAVEVMVVNSYHASHPWVVAHNDALRENLESQARLSFYFLDTKRTSPDLYQARAEIVFERVAKEKPDIVVLTDDNAVMFLGKRVMDLGIPVVFLGVNQNPREYLGTMELGTGVLERPLYKRSLLFLQDIMGESLKRCLILFDSGETSKVIMDTVFKGHRMLRLGYTVASVRLLDTFGQWKNEVQSLEEREYDALFVGLYHTLTDGYGRHVPSETVLEWTVANSPVPVFAYWDFSVGKGMAVGGLVNSGTPQGEAAAELVLKILSGRSPGTLYPVTPKDGQFLFSRHELARWGLVLPPDLTRGRDPVRFVE